MRLSTLQYQISGFVTYSSATHCNPMILIFNLLSSDFATILCGDKVRFSAATMLKNFFNFVSCNDFCVTTPDWWQSKTVILSTTVDQKKVRNRDFDCHLSPDWRQMAIENTVSRDCLERFFRCCLYGAVRIASHA